MAAGWRRGASRQREICDALSLAAQNISEQARQASGTLAEINSAGRRRRRRAKAALALQDELAARDRERLDAWSGSLAEMTAALRQEWQQAGADAASRQREICDALALAAQHIRTDAGPGQRHAGGNQPTGRRRRRRAQGRPRPARQAGRARPRAPGRLERLAGRDGRRAAPGMAAGRRRRRQPPARNLRCPAAGRAGHLRTRPRPGQRHAGGNQPPGRRRRRGAAARPAGRAGGPRPGPPGRVDRHAGRDGRNAAPGMAAGRRQPPAADLRGAGRHRPPDLGSIARPRQRHAGRDQPPGRCRRRGARPPSPCKATWWPDEARLDAWTGSLADMAAALREEWQQTGAATASRQQEICDALAQAARDISEHTHTHASATIAEIERLAQAASEARARRRGHRRTASEAVRQPGPRQRHAGRARPPARHARDPAGRRQPRIHRATRRRGRAGRHHLGTDGPGGRAVLGTRRIRNRQAGRDLGPGHRQRRRSGQPGRGLRRRGAAVQRVQRQAGHAARTHRGGAGQVHRPGRRTALLLRVAGARSGGPEPDVAKADHEDLQHLASQRAAGAEAA